MKTALLVLDFINDIVHPLGKIAASAEFIKENNVIQHTNETIALARKKHWPIIFIKVGFHAEYQECPNHSPVFSKVKNLGALQLNTWGTNFHDDIQKEENDLTLVKHRVSAFYATSLEAFLNAQQIERLIICGVSTDMAVQTTAREAHDRDYQVVIVSDACGAANTVLHEAAIHSLQRIAQIVKSNELGEVK